jgi:hypothetical protein
MAIPPLLEYSIIPGPSYYEGMSLLGNIPRVTNEVSREELTKFGREVMRIARADLGRRGGTGNLASTLRMRWEGEKMVIEAGGMMGVATTGDRTDNREVDYAAWVELGHKSRSGSWVSPHPFLRPAIQLALSGEGENGGVPEGDKILNEILYTARAKAAVTAPAAVAESALGLGGLLAMGAVAMTAFSAIYAGSGDGGMFGND